MNLAQRHVFIWTLWWHGLLFKVTLSVNKYKVFLLFDKNLNVIKTYNVKLIQVILQYILQMFIIRIYMVRCDMWWKRIVFKFKSPKANYNTVTERTPTSIK